MPAPDLPMDEILQRWLRAKLRHGWHALAYHREASHTYLRRTGGADVFGEVTLSAGPAQRFSFASRAAWPDDAAGDRSACEEAVLCGVLDELAVGPFPVLGAAVVLEAVGWDPVSSCEAGYYLAARHAARAILSVDERAANVEYGRRITE